MDKRFTDLPAAGALTNLDLLAIAQSPFGPASSKSVTGANLVTFINANAAFASSSNNLSFFAPTTSAQLAGVISDETGTGLLVFNINPTLNGATFSAALNMGGFQINNLGTPVATTDAATKLYVDTAGLGSKLYIYHFVR